MTRLSKTFAALALASLGLFACDREKASPAASAAPSAAAPSAQASAKPPEKPWFEGEWHATLDVQRHQIEQTKQEGKIKAWAEDDAKATGKGDMKLTIDGTGNVTGSVTGPLGELAAAGMLDENTLRVRFQPKQAELPPPEIFNGVLLAEKSGEGFAGDLQASSGDSLVVRKASVVLTKQGAGTPSANKGN